MPLELVTLVDAKQRLNVLHSDDDTALTNWLEAAEEEVLAYIGTAGQGDWYDGGLVSGEAVPKRVATAVIMLAGYYYRSPDADEGKEFQAGWLPAPVMALLHQLRDPALS